MRWWDTRIWRAQLYGSRSNNLADLSRIVSYIIVGQLHLIAEVRMHLKCDCVNTQYITLLYIEESLILPQEWVVPPF